MSRVSVIVPARNAAATISRALASLAPDKGLIGEIILIDDRSGDATADSARMAAHDLGLPLAAYRVSAGSAGAARNAGLDRATLPLVFFIDADDLLVAGGLEKLVTAIDGDAEAGLAIGTSIRKTPGSKDLARVPSGYGTDPVENAERYLLNRAPPISMGSGLVRTSMLAGIRFPQTIAIDEDTWFWSALLASAGVAVTTDPVLNYHLDGQRTARRYLDRPQRAWLDIAREFRRLRSYGVSDAPLKWRRAWVAQRFARQLVKHGRHADAAALLRPVIAHPALGREWRTTRYRLLSGAGRHIRPGRKPTAAFHKGKEHRTLVVCHDPAWPPVSGADLRNVQNVAAAASLGPARLVSLRPHDQNGPAAPGFTIASLTQPDDPRAASANWPRFGIEPRISVVALQRLLVEIRQFRPDTVIVEGIGLQAFLRPLRRHVPQLVLDMHNVESSLARQIRAFGGQGTAAGLEARLIRWRETQALKRADRVWTCTRDDRNRLLSAQGVRTPVHVIPNGIPRFDEIPPRLDDLPLAEAPSVLFVGHLGYAPNVDAARRLAHDIHPLIRTRLPQARLLLAGRYPKPPVKALADLPGVELHENPDRLAGLFARADLSLVPLRAGGGSRIKILEAAAWGIPVVATPLAAEGLDLEPDRHILLAESDAELARLATDLLSDPQRWSLQRQQARLAALQGYAPDAIKAALYAGLGLDA